MYDFSKPFIYYVYSLTYNIKFVHILLMKQIGFSYSNERNELNHTFKVGNFSEIESIREFNKNLLKNYDEELVNKGHFFTGSTRKLTMHIRTFYYSNDYDDYVQIVRELEENGERVAGIFLPGTLSTPLREEEEKTKKKNKL